MLCPAPVLLGRDSVEELVAVYLEDTAEPLAAMQTSLEQQDIGAIRSAAHAVKGDSANLGFTTLSVLCKRLETAPGEAVPWLLADAAAEYAHLAGRLRERGAMEVGG